MPHQVTIISATKMPVFSGPRVGQADLVITYTADNGAASLIIIPKTDPSEQDVKDAIKKDLADRGALIGKTFTV